jgi:hypothetical protein
VAPEAPRVASRFVDTLTVGDGVDLVYTQALAITVELMPQ